MKLINLEMDNDFLIEKITEKLIKLGYKKQTLVKNLIFDDNDFLSKLNNMFDDEDKKNLFYENYKSTIENNIPDFEFTVNGFTIGIFKNKNTIEITCDGKDKKIDNLTVLEILPFKKYKISDFYKLFIEKKYNIESLLLTSDN